MTDKDIERFISRNSSKALPIVNTYLKAYIKAYFIGTDTTDSDYSLLADQLDRLYNQFSTGTIDFHLNYYDSRFLLMDAQNYRNIIYSSIRDNSFNMLAIVTALYYSIFTIIYSDGQQHKSGEANYFKFIDSLVGMNDYKLNLNLIIPPVCVFACCFYTLNNVSDYTFLQADYLTFIRCVKAARVNLFQEMQLNIDILNVDSAQITFNLNYILGQLNAGRFTDEGHTTDEIPPTYTDYSYDVFIESMDTYEFTFIDDSVSIQAITNFLKEVLSNGKTRYSYRVFYPQNKHIKRLVLRNHLMEELFDMNILVDNYIPSFTLDSDKTYLYCYFDI
jgi:hypothetical protein